MQQQETKKTRRIRQVSVTNLFGTFNHIIPLKMDEHITIIHGPNGFGKTVMLKLLHALFGPLDQLSQNDQILQRIPFDEFRVDFEDNTSFWVRKTTQSIVFHATDKELYSLRSKLLPKVNMPYSPPEVDFTSEKSRRLQELWKTVLIDEPEGLGDRLSAELIGARTKMPEWLVDIRKSVPIRFIETQRLLSSTVTTESEYAVTEDSRHLVEVIQRKLAEATADTLSQPLAKTLSTRLISPTLAQYLQVTKEELLDKLEKLEQKRSHLVGIGLIDQKTGTEFPIDSEQGIEDTPKVVLAVYIDDIERKLGFFDEFVKKIDLLTTIINKHFLYKTLTISKESGFVFTTENGTNLPLEDLSSGEQYELVLFYALLFRVDPGSLILIDEPELSLHVVWQRRFLKDILQIAALTKIDAILATHSPSLISDRRDLLVRLKEPENVRL